MRWEDFRQSANVEDRRGDGEGVGASGMPFGGGGGLGIGAVIVLGLIGYMLGIDPRILISGAEMAGVGRSQPQYEQRQQAQPRQPGTPPTDQTGRFVSAVLAQNEDVWSEILPAQKQIRFKPAPLVLFSGATRSGCGAAQSAMGPFYCPGDQKVCILNVDRAQAALQWKPTVGVSEGIERLWNWVAASRDEIERR
jgi:predicted metalloprotease